MAVALAAWLAAVPHGGVCAVLGVPGSGKSRALKDADQGGALGARRVVFDPYARRDALLAKRKLSPGAPWGGVYVAPRDLKEVPEQVLDFDQVRAVVAPDSLDPGALAQGFDWTVRACWAAGDVSLVAEECGLYGRRSLDAVMRVASGGRHALMRLFLVCQSLGRLPLDARRHVSHLVAFAQGEPSDLDDLRSRCGADFVSRVQLLQPGDAPELWKLGDGLNRKKAVS